MSPIGGRKSVSIRSSNEAACEIPARLTKATIRRRGNLTPEISACAARGAKRKRRGGSARRHRKNAGQAERVEGTFDPRLFDLKRLRGQARRSPSRRCRLHGRRIVAPRRRRAGTDVLHGLSG